MLGWDRLQRGPTSCRKDIPMLETVCALCPLMMPAVRTSPEPQRNTVRLNHPSAITIPISQRQTEAQRG